MSTPITPADREAWLAAAERDLAVLKTRANELERRWARIQSDFGVLNAASQTSPEASHA